MVAVLSGCGGSSSEPLDASTPILAVTDSGGMTVETLTLSQTSVGQSSTANLRVTNTGSGATGLLAISINGAAANDFVLDNALSTCAGKVLAANESCDVVVSFRPTAAGERSASLAIASTPGGSHTVQMIGLAVMPDLHFNPTSLAFGRLEIGQSAQTTIELRNDGSGPAPIDAIAIAGAGFSKGFSTCGSTLAAGTSCDITIHAAPQSLGALAGTVSVTSAGTGYSGGLAVNGARKVTVVTSGTGSATLSSSPVGIDCGTTCSALFEGPVTLTAAPGASSQITSWSVAGCAQASSCVVPADVTPITVTLSVALTGSSSVNIVFAGDGTGEVQVRKQGTGVIATCFASCPVPVDAGDEITIRASTFSTFGGLAGCTSIQTAECSLTVPVGTSTVTSTFTKHAKEGWTRLIPGTTPRAASFDGSGNLIVGSSTKLTKLAPGGSTLWALDLAVTALETGPSDTIYLVTSAGVLKKLAADGTELWSRATSAVCPQGHAVAVGADGAVAVRLANAVSRWDTAGTASWTKTLAVTSNYWCSAGIDGSGNVLVDIADLDSGESTSLRRFAPDGTELTVVPDVSPEYAGMLSTSPLGSYVVCTSGHGNSHIVGPGVASNVMISGSGYASNWCAIAGTEVGWVYMQDEAGPGLPFAWEARRYMTGSVQTMAVARPILRTSVDRYGTLVQKLAGGSSGRMAVVGHYYGITSESAWVQVFEQ